MSVLNDRAAPAILIAAHCHSTEQIGGAFKLATELAEYLANAGHRVCYLCGTKESAPSNPTMIGRVEVWRYSTPKLSANPAKNLIRHVRGAYRLAKEIKKHAPIVCLNGHSPLQFLGASLAVGKDALQVYSVHSPFADEVESNSVADQIRLRQRFKVQFAKRIEGISVRRADVVQGFSRFTAARIAQLYGPKAKRKTVVSPGWVDVERFQPIEYIAAPRATLGDAWQTPAPIFFTVRRLEARMGLEQLIEAAKSLRARKHEFRVIIGGGGALADKLKRMVDECGLEETVYLVGRISDQDLPRCFGAADCFVLPTRALECFGLIVLEAYACGTPVIGTPVGAIPELVAEQGTEWLTRDTGAEAIADRMAAFLRGELSVDRARLRTHSERYRAELGLENLSYILLQTAAAR